jgi:hypothetical protein
MIRSDIKRRFEEINSWSTCGHLHGEILLNRGRSYYKAPGEDI